MNIIYLYDEFMRVPDDIDGQSIYIFDNNLLENYKISQKIIQYRYNLAKQSKADIYQGDTLEVINELHSTRPISSITTKDTFIPKYQSLFQQLDKKYKLKLLPDYFLSTDSYLQPAKRFFQYWNKIKKPLKY